MSRKINLGIETALGGGSFSIFEDGQELDFMCNLSSRSTAEDLLLIIENLLLKNYLVKEEINKIIYSGGPGSQTGIRIGAATAKALALAFSCECSEVGLLYALTFYTEQKGLIQTMIQVSEKEFYLQVFEKTEITVAESQPERVFKNDLSKHIENQKYQQTIIILKKDDMELKKSMAKNLIFLEMQNNFARLLNLSNVMSKQCLRNI